MSALSQFVSDLQGPSQPADPNADQPNQPADPSAGGTVTIPEVTVVGDPNATSTDPAPAPEKSEHEGAAGAVAEKVGEEGLLHVAEAGLRQAGAKVVEGTLSLVALVGEIATGPGDTSLPRAVFQAVTEDDIPVPGAIWHRRRENAEKDAREHTEKTGQATKVEESTDKAVGGVEDD
jgi:hypothetical protein